MPNIDIAELMFLTADSAETPQHVGGLATFTIPDDAPEDYVHTLADRLRTQTTVAAPFNYRLKTIARVPVSWETMPDDHVDFDYHFRHSALPKPGGERELGVLVSRLQSRPLDPTRPLWEFHLIEGLDRNRFAMYFKAHHALMDGVGAVTRMQQMIGPDPAAGDVRAWWTIGPHDRLSTTAPPRSWWGQGRRTAAAATMSVTTIAALTKAATEMVVNTLHNTNRDLAVPFAAPKSIINGPIGRQRRVATQTFEFDRIRRVAKARNVTINDVFLAVCSSGLRRYLGELGELPNESLIAGTPVNVREEGDESTTNAFSLIVVKMGTQIADPIERLAAIARSSKTGKNELRRLPTHAVGLYPALFMGPFIGQNLVGIGGHVAPPYNVSISNVPGPLEPQYLAGARLEAMYPIGMLYHGIALMIATLTMSGRFAIGFTGDRDALPHLQRLAVYTGEALTELEQALGV